MKIHPEISVIIPIKNEAETITQCIEGILSQTIPVNEIIAIDSGSTDGTLELLGKYEKVKLVTIDAHEFNHGETRNLGVSYSKSEYCLLTVGDAVPVDEHWIENLYNGFVSKKVVAVCGQQVVPHDLDKNPLEWSNLFTKPLIKTYSFSKKEFESFSPEQQKDYCVWDDVTAIYKTEILRKIPFRKTSFAEDALWAKDALLSGYMIAYNRAARVYHYHSTNAEFTFKRTFTIAYHLYKFFGLLPKIEKNATRKTLGQLKRLIYIKKIPFNDKIYWWRYNQAIQKNRKRAIRQFLDLYNKGESFLDEYHNTFFELPPVPVKREKMLK